MMKTLRTWLAAGCAAFCGVVMAQGEQRRGPVSAELAQMIREHKQPRLVVVMVFDQLTSEYVSRFSDQFSGGFKRLMEDGAFFADAHYSHIPTYTGPGHATVLSGATLGDSGIVANEWVTSSGLGAYCVTDPGEKTVGPAPPSRFGSSSPRNLLCSTVGDELRLSNNGLSKVVGVAIKDRACILLTGHNPTAAVWFDSGVGAWVTSSYYGESLPGFADRANRERVADRWASEKWDYLLPKEKYDRSHAEGAVGDEKTARGMGVKFPKTLSPSGKADKEYWERMILSPFGNALTFETAKLAIEDEKLGADEHTDLLALNFSSVDLAGHAYGPQSPEMQDFVLRTDVQLGDFLEHLEKSVPGGLNGVWVVVTADHAVAPVPDWAKQFQKLDAARVRPDVVVDEARAALAARFPDKTTDSLVTKFGEPYLYLNLPGLEAAGIDRVEAQHAIAERVARLPYVFAVHTHDDIAHGRLPNVPYAHLVYHGFNPSRCGDLLVLLDPFCFASSYPGGTTHGSRFAYDTHVPILFAGPGIRKGLYAERADVRDIAPTLSFLLGIKAPSSSSGRVLDEMLN